MTKTDIVDQDANVESLHKLLQCGVVTVLILCKVHCKRFGADLWAIFGRNIRGKSGELGLGARDENQVVALLCESKSKFLANAIGGAGDEGPGTAGTKVGKLFEMSAIACNTENHDVRIGLEEQTN